MEAGKAVNPQREVDDFREGASGALFGVLVWAAFSAAIANLLSPWLTPLVFATGVALRRWWLRSNRERVSGAP